MPTEDNQENKECSRQDAKVFCHGRSISSYLCLLGFFVYPVYPVASGNGTGVKSLLHLFNRGLIFSLSLFFYFPGAQNSKSQRQT